MKRNTPLITLLVGAALGVVLLVANMLATPSGTPVNYSAAAASSAAPSSAAPAESSPATSAAPSESSEAPGPSPAEPAESSSEAPEPTRTTPTRADFAGRVGGGGGSVAVAVHGDKAVAYVCNGSTVEGWMRGKVENGKLTLTGKNKAHLTASYHAGKVTGDVEAHGTDYSFSVSTVSKSSSKSSGLYQATAVVQGKTIKAGWIVLGDGTQIGSVETGESAKTAVTAPKLDVATMTARIGNVVLHAVPVSGVTGSGF
jgi:serine/threonine-protein kinase